MNLKNKMGTKNILANIIAVGNKIDKRNTTFSLAKLLEESGEFAQAALSKSGFTSIKKLKHEDQVFEEACDSIIMIMDVLGKVYRKQLESGELTERALIDKVFEQIPLKMRKWEEAVKTA